eukprot:scaffold172835_cov32-Tisochrysis_lutea.AAC.1
MDNRAIWETRRLVRKRGPLRHASWSASSSTGSKALLLRSSACRKSPKVFSNCVVCSSAACVRAAEPAALVRKINGAATTCSGDIPSIPSVDAAQPTTARASTTDAVHNPRKRRGDARSPWITP